MMSKSSYRQLSGLVRKYLRDWRDSGCVGVSLAVCVRAACERLGVPEQAGKRLLATCYEPSRSNDRLFRLNEHVTGVLLVTRV